MLSIISENVYIPEIYPILNVDQNIDYTIKLEFDTTALNLNHELITLVSKIYNIYYKFLNYSIIKNETVNASIPVKNTSVKDYDITTIKDRDGNIIKTI